jgi:predicted phage terminase large subunit-like protein
MPAAQTAPPSIPALTPEIIHGLSVSCLATRYDEPKPVPPLHMEMWAYACSPAKQVAIAAPRNHAKSTALTFAYALALLLFRFSKHLLIVSANEALATEFLNDIRIELQENEILIERFGPFKFIRDRDAEIVVQHPDGTKFRILCKGANQRMRGLKWERKRPDTVLCDDLEDDEIVLNEDRRDRFMRWFYGALLPIIKAGGIIRLFGTILHHDSLLARTMPKEKNEFTVNTALKRYSTDPDTAWHAILYRAHDADYDHILWPEQFNESRLKAIRADFAEMGMLDVYNQEYLNDPTDQSTAFFRREDMLPMRDGDYETRKTIYVGVDLAISSKQRRAYTVFVVGGVDATKGLHIVDVRRARLNSLEIIGEIFNIFERWSRDGTFGQFRFESEQIEKTLRPVLDAEMVKRQIFIPYDSRPPTKDKESRARAFQFRTRAGNVRFDKRASWYADYEEELVHFPRWPFKDQVDASAWLGDLIAEEITAATDEDLEEAEYQAMIRTDSPQGRSATTGY